MPPAAVPSPDDVLDLAEAVVLELAPSFDVERVGLALVIVAGEKRLTWNLHDVTRLAVHDPEWAAGVEKLARQVLARLGIASDDGESADAQGAERATRMELRFRPAVRLSPELLESPLTHEIAPGIFSILVQTDGSKTLRVLTPDDLRAAGVDEDVARDLALDHTLGDVRVGDLLAPLQEGVPIYTNPEFHPNVAALLLLTALWSEIASSSGIAPTSLLVLVPAPSRIFVALDDAPEIVAALDQLAAAAETSEDELLSREVLRFTGSGWALA